MLNLQQGFALLHLDAYLFFQFSRQGRRHGFPRFDLAPRKLPFTRLMLPVQASANKNLASPILNDTDSHPDPLFFHNALVLPMKKAA